MRRLLLLLLLLAPLALLLLPGEKGARSPLSVQGEVAVTVDGREVYRGEMHSLTRAGVDWLLSLLFYYTDANYYSPWVHYVSGGDPYNLMVDMVSRYDPIHSEYIRWLSTTGRLRGLLGYVVEDGLVRTVESTVGKGWGYNSTHSWFIITASFIAPEDLTLRWFALQFYRRGDMPIRVVLSNDTLPSVQVSKGAPVAVTLTFYWRDNGALMENWFKLLDAVLLHDAYSEVTLFNTDGTQTVYFIHPDFDGSHVSQPLGMMRVKVALGTDCRANPSRSVRALYNEVARVTPGFSLTGKGLAASFTVPSENICEVGLVVEYKTKTGETKEALLLRYSTGTPVQPGTVFTLYLLPPAGD